MPVAMGFRSRSEVIGRGTFVCPNCGGGRQYDVKRRQQWATLLFIPLAPIRDLGRFVQCRTCLRTFDLEVLATGEVIQQQLTGAIREAVVALLRPKRSPEAEMAAAAAVSALTGYEWTAEHVSCDIKELDTEPLDARLVALSGVLKETDKDRFVTACARACGSRDGIDGRSRFLIDHIGALLLVAPDHLGELVEAAYQIDRPLPVGDSQSVS